MTVFYYSNVLNTVVGGHARGVTVQTLHVAIVVTCPVCVLVGTLMSAVQIARYISSSNKTLMYRLVKS